MRVLICGEPDWALHGSTIQRACWVGNLPTCYFHWTNTWSFVKTFSPNIPYRSVCGGGVRNQEFLEKRCKPLEQVFFLSLVLPSHVPTGGYVFNEQLSQWFLTKSQLTTTFLLEFCCHFCNCKGPNNIHIHPSSGIRTSFLLYSLTQESPKLSMPWRSRGGTIYLAAIIYL